MGKDGRISICAVCGSRFHWARDCPNKDSNALVAEEETEEQITADTVFLTFVMLSGKLIDESLGKALLDSGCTTTVAGEYWIRAHMRNVPIHLQNQVIKKTTYASVVFGGGEKVVAKYSLTIPAQIGDNVCFINTLVTDGKLPLLLSVNSMRKASVVLDFESGTASVMSGITVKLSTSSTGHLLLDISRFQPSPVVDLFCHPSLNRDQICKLHKQFAAHCSAGKLKSLIKNSNSKVSLDETVIDDVINNCDVCAQFGRAPPGPVVSLPLSSSWNSTVAIDLHQMTELGTST